MCGIVGIVSTDEVAPLLVKSIARLEYRGYDSCGVATLAADGIEVLKDAGVVEDVACRQGLAWLAGPFASYIRAGRLTRWYRRPMRTRTELPTETLTSFTTASSPITALFGPLFSARGTASPQEPTQKLLRICIVRNFDRLRSLANSVMIA